MPSLMMSLEKESLQYLFEKLREKRKPQMLPLLNIKIKGSKLLN